MESKSPDEIDLMAVLSKVVRKIKRNYWLFVSLTVIGFGIGLGSSFIVSKEYESQLIINSDIVMFPYADRIISTLNGLIKERDYEVVAEKLNLKEEEVRNLINIEIELLFENKVENSNKEEKSPEIQKDYLVITARTRDTQLLPQLQQGLLQYFQNNDYVKIRVGQRKEYYNALILEVEKQIRSLEELKSSVYSGAFFEDSKGTVSFDPTIVNSKIIALSKDRLEYKNRLQLVNSIEVMENFTPRNRPIRREKVQTSVLGALTGILLATIIVALRSLSKELNKTEPEGS